MAAKRRAHVDRDPNPPGAVTRVRARVQIAFRPERLVIARAPEDAVILDILIANRSQLVGADGVPASVFSPSAAGIQLDLATAAPGEEIAIDVLTSIGGGFGAAFFGAGGQPPQQFSFSLNDTLAGVDLLVEEAKKAVKWRADKNKPKARPVKRGAGAGRIKRDAKGNLIHETR